MIPYGILLIIISIILFFMQSRLKSKLKSYLTAKSATVEELQYLIRDNDLSTVSDGNLREYVKVRGTIMTNSPLVSEVRKKECVYYSTRMIQEIQRKETKRNHEGQSYNSFRTVRETVSDNTQSVPFILADPSGEIVVNPEGADIETIQVFNKFIQPSLGDLVKSGFKELLWSMWTAIEEGISSMLGVRNHAVFEKVIGHRHIETILPCNREVLVIGTAVVKDGKVTLGLSDASDNKFVISLKTEKRFKLMENSAKCFFYGTIGGLSIGLILLILGLVI